MPTTAIHFGATAISSRFLRTGGHGRGKVSLVTGSSVGTFIRSDIPVIPIRHDAAFPPCSLIEFSINTTAWTAGSTLLSLGLSAPQAIGCMVGVALISALVAVLAGWPGSHLYLGFTVLSRASWGMRGGFWPVLNRIVTACVWMGIQAYWGGQCKPKFAHFTTQCCERKTRPCRILD